MKKSENKQLMKICTIITGIITTILVVVAISVYISIYHGTEETNIQIKDNNIKIENSRNEIRGYMYNIIPGFTYECFGDQHLYLNMIYNDDNSIDIYGFALTEDKKIPIKDLEVISHLELEFDNSSIFYYNDYFTLFIEDDYLVMCDSRDDMKYSFQGDFFMVQEIVYLEYDEILDFFRDTNNFGKVFTCNLYYCNYVSEDYDNFHILQYTDEYGYKLTFAVTVPDINQRFFAGDIVTVTGIYTPYYNEPIDILIEGRYMEFYGR